MKKTLVLAAILATSISSAWAYDFNDVSAKNMYVTGNVGKSEFRHAGLTDSTDTTYGVAAGFQFHKNFAVELGYTDFGSFSGPFGPVSRVASVSAYDLSVLGSYEVYPKFSLTARIGLSDATLTDSIQTLPTTKQHKTVGVYGLGAQYKFTPNIAGTLEFTEHGAPKGYLQRVNHTTFGVKYSF